MKIGDKVRFLSETGGGIVAGFQGKDIVLVEDEDGFQIPTKMTDVVLVGDEDYSTRNVISKSVNRNQNSFGKNNTLKTDSSAGSHELKDSQVEPEVTFRKPVEERKGGDSLSVYLAFVPIDCHEMTKTRFESYLVNDSNYYIYFTYMVAEGKSWQLKASGEVEPNTKLFVEEFGREVLNEMEHVAVQLLAYKRHKPFLLKETVSVDVRIDPVKFYKLHTFRENDFFESPAMVHTLVENDVVARSLVVDAQKMKQYMYGKASSPADSPGLKSTDDRSYVRRYDNGSGHHPFINKVKEGQNAPVVVDLHANEVLETTAGMSPQDILNYQLEVFNRTLNEHRANKGQKIIFIHGKGEGVLRNAIIHELKYKYKTYSYQDASFLEYGYGATQVTVR